MSLILRREVYEWLVSLALLKPVDFHSDEPQPVAFADQPYIYNGFTIGKLLQQLLAKLHCQAPLLLKMRKIAFLNTVDNWHIVMQLLPLLGYHLHFDPTPQHIITLLNHLHQQYSPNSPSTSIPPLKKESVIYDRININKTPNSSNNLLELMLLLLHSSLKLPLQECFGALIDNCRALKRVVLSGSRQDGFQGVICLYCAVLDNMDVIHRIGSNQSIAHFMEGLGQGIVSESQEVREASILVFEGLSETLWFRKAGVYVLMEGVVCPFLLQHVETHPKILQDLQQHISIDTLLSFLTGLLEYLPRSLYYKQILAACPINRCIDIVQKALSDDRMMKIRMKARELGRVLLQYYQVSPMHRHHLLIGFHVNKKEIQSIHAMTLMLSLLDSPHTPRREVIQVVLKQYQQGSASLKCYILDNAVGDRMNQCSDVIGLNTSQLMQSNEYTFWCQVAKKSYKTAKCLQVLHVALHYYTTQPHCESFLQVMITAYRTLDYTQNVNPVLEWSTSTYSGVLATWNDMDLPAPPKTIVSPPKGNPHCRRKEILLLNNYRKKKALLNVLAIIPDCVFLMGYEKAVSRIISLTQKHTIQEIRQTRAYLIQLRQAIRLRASCIQQSSPLTGISLSESKILNSEVLMTNVRNVENVRNVKHYEFIDAVQIQPNETQSQVNCLLREFTEDEDSVGLVSVDDLQNYEEVYARIVFMRQASLVQELYRICKEGNFLSAVGIQKYYPPGTVFPIPQSLSLFKQRLLQLALAAFAFKKHRRIQIRCLDSFMSLLQRNVKTNPIHGNDKVPIKKEMHFKYCLQTKTKQPYSLCFQIVDFILFQALQLHQIQPLSYVSTTFATPIQISQTIEPNIESKMEPKMKPKMKPNTSIVAVKSRVKEIKEEREDLVGRSQVMRAIQVMEKVKKRRMELVNSKGCP